MTKVLRNPGVRLLLVIVAALGLLLANAALDTSKPVFSSTETIIVPNVVTGAPMELEVEREAAASADAAAYMKIDCSLRRSSGVQVTVFPWGTMGYSCGSTAGSGANSVNQVRDLNGAGCVYYGSTLAGCVSKGNWAYVGNRLNATGTFKLSPSSI